MLGGGVRGGNFQHYQRRIFVAHALRFLFMAQRRTLGLDNLRDQCLVYFLMQEPRRLYWRYTRSKAQNTISTHHTELWLGIDDEPSTHP